MRQYIEGVFCGPDHGDEPVAKPKKRAYRKRKPAGATKGK